MRISNTSRRRFALVILSSVLALQLAFPFPSFALFGGGGKIPSANQVASQLEQRYHVSTGAIQNTGESFNVSAQKSITPEVSLNFSPMDPKAGEKIVARAFPIYFSNPTSQLYYTWYLKRDGCDLNKVVPAGDSCNSDGSADNKVTENDWKVAATKIIFESNRNSDPDYTVPGTDSDSYSAEYGGDSEQGTSDDWCYVRHQQTGTLHEIRTGGVSNSSVSCGNAAHAPMCLGRVDFLEPTTFTINYDPGNPTSSSGEAFEVNTGYESVGAPGCNGGTVTCPSGTTPACKVSAGIFANAASDSAISCSVGGNNGSCEHVFPDPTPGTAGDGAFGKNEEQFWGADPNDPDTTDLGMKDEAVTVGVGLDSFAWNYQTGDKVGVAVEGVSMIQTKHDDSSSMIMWALSKNEWESCINKGTTGSYALGIRGYNVNIPTIKDFNIDDCLEDNLIDPLDGNQSKRLEVEVSASPENPVNDETAEKGGDVVLAVASVSNSSRSASELSYDWKVSVSDNPNGGWQDITADLKNNGLLQNSKGNGLSSISIALNMQTAFLNNYNASVPPDKLDGNDPLYLKIAPTVSENFSSGVARKGTSDVIVRVSNTTNKIIPYTANAALVGGSYKVSYGGAICNDPFIANPLTAADAMQNLNRIACRVMKNEVIGLKFSNEIGLSDFQWTLNGTPITCSANVSSVCGNGIFFAVAGNPGETYTIKASAVDTGTGKSVTLARTFQIVEPEVIVESDDQTLAWPKYIGTHTDLDGNSFDEYSDIAYETYGTGSIKLKARFLPGPAKFVSSDFGPDNAFGTADDVSRRIWMIDGVEVPETAPGSLAIDYTPATPKLPGEVYNVSFSAMLVQPVEKRQALKDIWGIDTLASSEIRVSQALQVDVVEPKEVAQGPKKFLAAISSYLPASVLFAFKITLSMALLLFTVGFVFALIPAEPRTDEVILSRRS